MTTTVNKTELRRVEKRKGPANNIDDTEATMVFIRKSSKFTFSVHFFTKVTIYIRVAISQDISDMSI